jgi:hypothetical protein
LFSVNGLIIQVFGKNNDAAKQGNAGEQPDACRDIRYDDGRLNGLPFYHCAESNTISIIPADKLRGSGQRPEGEAL